MRVIEPDDPARTYAAVLDALPVVAYMARPDGVISYVSHAWTKSTGKSAAEVLSAGYASVLEPADFERIMAVWANAVTSETSYRDEYRLRFNDGSFRWIVSQAKPMRDARTGEVVAWFGTITDIDAHRRAEAARREQTELNERLMASTDDAILVLELDGTLASMNASATRAIGALAAAGPAGPVAWVELLDPASRPAAADAVARARTGFIGRCTTRLHARAGRRSYDSVLTPIRDASGRLERVLVVSRDVSEQRQMQEALEANEATYRAFATAIPGIVWAASPLGDLTEPGDTADAGWHRRIHADDVASVRAAWARSQVDGAMLDCECRLRAEDGTYRWYLCRALAIRDEAGAIMRWVGVNIDVDERKLADEAREKFVALAEHSSDFIGIAALDGEVMYVNAAGRALLETGTVEDVAHTRIEEYFRPEDRASLASVHLPRFAREGRLRGECLLRNFRTGAGIPVSYTVFRLFDGNRRAIGLAVVARDIRERLRIDSGLQLLARAGAATLHGMDYHATLRNFAHAFTGGFATYCLIDVLDAEQRWERIAVHRDPRSQTMLYELAQPLEGSPIMRAIRNGESSIVGIDDRADLYPIGLQDRIQTLRYLKLRSFITVPIPAPSGEIVGALTASLDAEATRERYDEIDRSFVQEVGRRIGAAISNARLYERNRRIAVELQEASLPKIPALAGGLLLDAEYRPGSDESTIGGDWYDAFELADGRVAITIGDVLGHGLHAAITMTKLRQAMAAAAMVDPDPIVMLRVANETLGLLDADGYATALAALYDPQARTLTFASAGHPGPIVWTPDGAVREDACSGLMLGLRTAAERETCVVPLVPGGGFVFFTDGLVEATRDMEAGRERLFRALASVDVLADPQPAKAIVRFVLGETQAGDDIAVLVARVAE